MALDLPDLATRREVAEATRLAYKTLERWASEGRGPRVTKLGGAVRYRRQDVEAWVDECAAAGAK